MKKQVTIPKGSLLERHFKSLPEGANHSKEGYILMERGLRAGAMEDVVRRAIIDAVADLPLSASSPPADGDEDALAASAVDEAIGGYFDGEDDY